MSGLNNLHTRLSYRGGAKQQDRMIKDKVHGLRQALLYSYQADTIILSDGREFRCLINPNKLSMEADDKMLSIPFEDICLNKEKPEEEKTIEGLEPIGVKPGDVIEWKTNGTHWLIYSQYLQEKAYFRGLMRQCDEEIEINGCRYWVYLKGPDEKSIDWQKSKHFIFNELNYTLEMYISNTTETNEFFQRFKIIKIQGKPWEVQAVDRITTDGILAVYLKEYYVNEYSENIVEDIAVMNLKREIIDQAFQIEGPSQVYPFDIVTYSITGASGGKWQLSNKRARIIESNETQVKIEIVTGKSGDISLIYSNGIDIVKNIKILSL